MLEYNQNIPNLNITSAESDSYSRMGPLCQCVSEWERGRLETKHYHQKKIQYVVVSVDNVAPVKNKSTYEKGCTWTADESIIDISS